MKIIGSFCLVAFLGIASPAIPWVFSSARAADFSSPLLITMKDGKTTIVGHVYDETGQPLAGVRVVTVSSTGNALFGTSISDAHGEFHFSLPVPIFYLNAFAPELRIASVTPEGSGQMKIVMTPNPELAEIHVREPQPRRWYEDNAIGDPYLPPPIFRHFSLTMPTMTVGARWMIMPYWWLPPSERMRLISEDLEANRLRTRPPSQYEKEEAELVHKKVEVVYEPVPDYTPMPLKKKMFVAAMLGGFAAMVAASLVISQTTIN